MNTRFQNQHIKGVGDDDRPRNRPRVEGGGGGVPNGDRPPTPSPTTNIGTNRPRPIAHVGGQHQAAIGTSTTDKSDRQSDLEALENFNRELERVCFGQVAGREW